MHTLSGGHQQPAAAAAAAQEAPPRRGWAAAAGGGRQAAPDGARRTYAPARAGARAGGTAGARDDDKQQQAATPALSAPPEPRRVQAPGGAEVGCCRCTARRGGWGQAAAAGPCGTHLRGRPLSRERARRAAAERQSPRELAGACAGGGGAFGGARGGEARRGSARHFVGFKVLGRGPLGNRVSVLPVSHVFRSAFHFSGGLQGLDLKSKGCTDTETQSGHPPIPPRLRRTDLTDHQERSSLPPGRRGVGCSRFESPWIRIVPRRTSPRGSTGWNTGRNTLRSLS